MLPVRDKKAPGPLPFSGNYCTTNSDATSVVRSDAVPAETVTAMERVLDEKIPAGIVIPVVEEGSAAKFARNIPPRVNVPTIGAAPPALVIETAKTFLISFTEGDNISPAPTNEETNPD